MSYTDVERLWKLPLNHREKLLLLYILLRGVCYAKTATQIEETGLSRTRFYRLRKQLHTDGYIEKLDRTDPRVPPTAPEDCDDIYRACPERWEALRQSHRRTSSVPQAHLHIRKNYTLTTQEHNPLAPLKNADARPILPTRVSLKNSSGAMRCSTCLRRATSFSLHTCGNYSGAIPADRHRTGTRP
jgi:hypothetical protein